MYLDHKYHLTVGSAIKLWLLRSLRVPNSRLQAKLRVHTTSHLKASCARNISCCSCQRLFCLLFYCGHVVASALCIWFQSPCSWHSPPLNPWSQSSCDLCLSMPTFGHCRRKVSKVMRSMPLFLVPEELQELLSWAQLTFPEIFKFRFCVTWGVRFQDISLICVLSLSLILFKK